MWASRDQKVTRQHTLAQRQGFAESEVFEVYDAIANRRRMEAKLEGLTTNRRL